MANTLDNYFGPREPAAVDMRSVRMEGEGRYRSKHNPLTRQVARDLQQDTPLPLVGEGGKALFGVAARLLTEFKGDTELIHRALERCRQNGKWRELAQESIYKAMPSIVQTAYALRKEQHPVSDADKWLAEQGLPPRAKEG